MMSIVAHDINADKLISTYLRIAFSDSCTNIRPTGHQIKGMNFAVCFLVTAMCVLYYAA